MQMGNIRDWILSSIAFGIYKYYLKAIACKFLRKRTQADVICQSDFFAL